MNTKTRITNIILKNKLAQRKKLERKFMNHFLYDVKNDLSGRKLPKKAKGNLLRKYNRYCNFLYHYYPTDYEKLPNYRDMKEDFRSYFLKLDKGEKCVEFEYDYPFLIYNHSIIYSLVKD